jgi:hypothetical protein
MASLAWPAPRDARPKGAPSDETDANVAKPTTQRTASAINPLLDSFRSDTPSL